jgi:hypothetical protein
LVKQKGPRADHTPPRSAKDNVFSYASTPPYAFGGYGIIKNRCHLSDIGLGGKKTTFLLVNKTT